MRKSSGNRKQSNKSAAQARKKAASEQTDSSNAADASEANVAEADKTSDEVSVADSTDDVSLMSRFEQLDEQLQLPNNADQSASPIDPAQVEEIAVSSRQILQAVANQGDAISELAAALGAMRASLLDLSATPALPVQEDLPTAESHESEDGAQEEGDSKDSLEPWEQIKNAILESSAAESSERGASEDVAESSDAQQKVNNVADDEDSSIDEECGVLFDLVSQEDIDAMDESRLRTLVIDQERIISRLARRVQQKSRRDLQLTPEQLQECAKDLPDELAVRVETTLQTLDEQARLGELELSLDRARISRQLSQLEATREIIESNARHLGLEIDGDGKIEGSTSVGRKAGSKGRRWLGALGFVE